MNAAKEKYIKENSLTESTLTKDDKNKIKSICDGIEKKYTDDLIQDKVLVDRYKISRDIVLQQLRDNINLDKIMSLFLNYFNSATLVIASDIADYIRSGVLTERPDVFNIFTSIELISLRDKYNSNNLPPNSKKIMERFNNLIQQYGLSSTHGGSSNATDTKNSMYRHDEYLIIVVIIIFLFLMILWIQYFQPHDSYQVTLLNTLPMNDNNFFGDVCRVGQHRRE
jgi:hypothetical protein